MRGWNIPRHHREFDEHVITEYSFYLLSWTDEVGNKIRKAKVEEEEKKSQSDQNKPKIESDSKYYQLIIDYFKELEALPEGESCEKYCTEWSKRLKHQIFMDYCLSIIEYSSENFDE